MQSFTNRIARVETFLRMQKFRSWVGIGFTYAVLFYLSYQIGHLIPRKTLFEPLELHRDCKTTKQAERWFGGIRCLLVFGVYCSPTGRKHVWLQVIYI